MWAKTLLKNPIFMIGILLSIIFLYQAKQKGYLGTRTKLIPTSCKAVLVKLDRRIPANWQTKCEGNNLAVFIKYVGNFPLGSSPQVIKKVLYRELANNLKLIAINSPSDNLERTDWVRIHFMEDTMDINAIVEGHHLVKLQTMTSPKLIAEHLKVTVKVQEKIK